MSKIELESTAFGAGEQIPTVHTGEGVDTSPVLSWAGVPAGTKELALIMDDPDAPTPQPWVHWVLCKIPAGTAGLPGGVARDAPLKVPPGAVQGRNTFGKVGYYGPMPPKGHGVHRYYFKLYALDQPLVLTGELTKESALAAMRGHVIGEGELIGTYERK